MDEADRLLGGSAARPGNACDGHGEIGRRVGEGTFRHRARNLLADGTLGGEKRRRNRQELGLGLVRIGDKPRSTTADEPGDFGEHRRDQAARARLRSGDLQMCLVQRSMTSRASGSRGSRIGHPRSSERQPKRCGRDRRDALAAADRAKALVGGRLDADPIFSIPQIAAIRVAHRVAVGARCSAPRR